MNDQLLKDSKHFCMAPWVHMHFWPNGNVIPCCVSDTRTPVGNTNSNTLEEIWNGSDMRQLRLNMLADVPSAICLRCYDQEKSNVYTLRRHLNEAYAHHQHRAATTTADGTVPDVNMAYLDVRFSNICNLRCRSCCHDLSSGWYDDWKVMHPEYDQPRILNINKSGDFWSQLLPYLNQAEEVYFAGGESLMTEEHYQILDHWIATGHTDVRIRYTTNFTVLDYKKRDLFELWKQFPNIVVTASLDASGKRAEYLRKNTVWDNIVENRRRMLREIPHVKFNITPTVSLMNVQHLPDFHREWIELGLLEPDNVRINILELPEHSSVKTLPAGLKDKVRTRLGQHMDWLRTLAVKQDSLDAWQSILNVMDSEDYGHHLKDWYKDTAKLDQLRNENIWTVFPELRELNPSFCSLPWVNLNTTPMGQCKLCCNISDFKVMYAQGDERNGKVKRVFNWGADDIESIWNSIYMVDVRTHMLEGQQIKDCGECYASESIGAKSARQAANDKFQIEDPQPKAKSLPISLELRLSNRCNLTCVSCWSGSSHSIAAERQTALSADDMPAWLHAEWNNDISINFDRARGFDSDINYINQPMSMENFLAVAPTLERLYITGGEPTMDANIYAYLEALADCGNTQCHVSFTTNCTLWNEKLMNALSKFPHNEIQLSMDGHEDMNEYLRYPTKWPNVLDNVERYMTDSRVDTLRIFTVYSAINAAQLAPLLHYVINTANRLSRKVIWWPILLTYPIYHRVQILEAHTRSKIASDLEAAMLDPTRWHEAYCDHRHGLDQVLLALKDPCDDSAADNRLRLTQHLDTLDRIRNQNWRQQLPLLSDVI
jgi:sulfatase maturation enzyme AslB (radical SAM superfamily)